LIENKTIFQTIPIGTSKVEVLKQIQARKERSAIKPRIQVVYEKEPTNLIICLFYCEDDEMVKTYYLFFYFDFNDELYDVDEGVTMMVKGE